MNEEMLILVNEHDQEIGLMEKHEAHERGLLHRAFSVLIFDYNNQLILQQRASSKYHSAMLWTNTCCGHPRPHENIQEAAQRRLNEEMGFTSELQFLFKFQYKTKFENSLIENEIDYVFIGRFDGIPIPTKEEVHAWKKTSIENIILDIEENPNSYTTWFKHILEQDSEIVTFLNS
jgi:isopentenyl-diphosphate delta-isomerase